MILKKKKNLINEPPKKAQISDVNEFNKSINGEKMITNGELFQKLFKFPTAMLTDLYSKDNKQKNNRLVDVIKSGLSNLKGEIEQMSEGEKKIEGPDKIVDIVEKIFEFNRQNQERQGLKILTPDQILSRLPTSSSQLEAGNNSGKLKNEIRQLLYSLYHSKRLSKTIYNTI